MNTTNNLLAFELNDSRLAEIMASDARLAEFTGSQVRDFCCADWPEGDEHQAWLDHAPAVEIAAWALVGLKDARDES